MALFAKRSNVKAIFEKDMADPSDHLKVPILYLSFIESKSYSEEIRNALGNGAFILARSKGEKYEPIENEWERFVHSVLELLKS